MYREIKMQVQVNKKFDPIVQAAIMDSWDH